MNIACRDHRIGAVLEIQAALLEKHLTQNAGTGYRLFLLVAPDDDPQTVSAAFNIGGGVGMALFDVLKVQFPYLVTQSKTAPDEPEARIVGG
jgi:hypothetical protein